MRGKYLLSVFYLILLITASAGEGYCQFSEDTVSLEPISFSATRQEAFIDEVPASVSVIEKEDIQGLQATVSLDESLRKVPGIFVNNRYNLSQGERLSIRGLGSRAQFGVRSIKVLLDGIPMTFPDGTTQLNNLDLGFVGRMELLRGPASTLYGNAAGGVLNIETETPPMSQLSLTPRITTGSFGLLKMQAKLGGRFSDNGDYLISFSGTDTEGFREFSSARLYNMNSIFHFYPGERTTVTFTLNLMSAPYMYNPSSLSKEDAEEEPEKARSYVREQVAGKAVKQGQAGISVETGVGESGEIRSTLYGVGRDLYNPIPGAIIDLERWSGGLRTVYENDINLSGMDLTLLSGADIEYQADQRAEFNNPGLAEDIRENTEKKDLINLLPKGDKLLDQQERVFSKGVFANLSFKLAERLRITGGARYDHYTFYIDEQVPEEESGVISFDQLNPAVGVLYEVSDNIGYYANFSTSFQTPTANEFSNDPSGGGFNESLKPERIKSIETGIRKSGGKLKGEIAAFYFNVDNQLIPYQANPGSDITYYRNAGRTRNAGLEFYGEYSPVAQLRFLLNYTFMQYQFTDYEVQSSEDLVQLAGNYVPGVPAHQLFAGVQYAFLEDFVAEVNLRYTGSYYANDFNGPEPGESGPESNYINDQYWLTDLRAGYEKDLGRISLTVFAGVNNLFDIRYNGSITPNAFGGRFFEPAPGRNYYVGIAVPVEVIE